MLDEVTFLPEYFFSLVGWFFAQFWKSSGWSTDRNGQRVQTHICVQFPRIKNTCLNRHNNCAPNKSAGNVNLPPSLFLLAVMLEEIIAVNWKTSLFIRTSVFIRHPGTFYTMLLSLKHNLIFNFFHLLFLAKGNMQHQINLKMPILTRKGLLYFLHAVQNQAQESLAPPRNICIHSRFPVDLLICTPDLCEESWCCIVSSDENKTAICPFLPSNPTLTFLAQVSILFFP